MILPAVAWSMRLQENPRPAEYALRLVGMSMNPQASS